MNTQPLKKYLTANPSARVRITWNSASKGTVWTVYEVTEICNNCFFGRVLEGEPSRGKPWWAVLEWKPA